MRTIFFLLDAKSFWAEELSLLYTDLFKLLSSSWLFIVTMFQLFLKWGIIIIIHWFIQTVILILIVYRHNVSAISQMRNYHYYTLIYSNCYPHLDCLSSQCFSYFSNEELSLLYTDLFKLLSSSWLFIVTMFQLFLKWGIIIIIHWFIQTVILILIVYRHNVSAISQMRNYHYYTLIYSNCYPHLDCLSSQCFSYFSDEELSLLYTDLSNLLSSSWLFIVTMFLLFLRWGIIIIIYWFIQTIIHILIVCNHNVSAISQIWNNQVIITIV